MRSVKDGYFVLGCMDRDEPYALPLSVVEQHLSDFNTTEKDGGIKFWHIALTSDDGRLALNLSKVGQKIDLTPYSFKLESTA
jgi:hypothetical protein